MKNTDDFQGIDDRSLDKLYIEANTPPAARKIKPPKKPKGKKQK